MNVQVTKHLNLSHLNNLFSLCEAIPKEQSAIEPSWQDCISGV